MTIAALALILAGGAPQASEPELPTFTDVSDEAGITFEHSFGDHDLSNIVEGTGPGCAFLDYDGDGLLDLYFVNGCWLREVSDNKGRDLRGKLSNALYRNEGEGTFTDVTAKAGVGDRGYGLGVSAADFDDDGDLDLYVLNFGANVLYRNEGDGTFADVSKASGLDDSLWSVSAPWLDYDGDGDLDVYVVNYLEYDAGQFRDVFPAAVYPGPLSYNGQPDKLYRNEGDGTFTDVTERVGLIGPENGRGMSGVASDLDGDGRLDLYVANDATPNFYFRAKGDGTFEEQAMKLGMALGEGGQGASSMGPVVGDVDRDGSLDLYIPDMGYGCLLVSRQGFFEDMTARSKLAKACGQYTGWGAALFDYDNDGWLDVFVANGHAHREFTEEDVLMRNTGSLQFADVAQDSGEYFHEKYVGRGAACGDYDNDGDLDLLVMVLSGRPRLLRNNGAPNGWLTIVPRRAGSGSIALGAVVEVTVGELTMTREVVGVSGYLSRGDPRAHFGLGQAKRADSVEIRWPDGGVTRRENVDANQFVEIRQSQQ